MWTILFGTLAALALNACTDTNNVSGPPPPVPLSPDAKLSSLTVNTEPLDPEFSSDIAKYTVNVATSVANVIVTARPEMANASMTVNGQPTPSGQPRTITLNGSGLDTFISIEVTAPNGSQNTYTVNVNRAGNNNLKGLTVSPGTLTPSFSTNTTNYTVNVASTIDNVTVMAEPQDTGATVSIDGQTTTSRSVSLGVPGSSTSIPIEVTVPNGDPKTYAVVVNRAVLSGNNNLSNLVVSAGSLTPPFDAMTTSYDVQTSIFTAETTVTATVADSTATLKINGKKATSAEESENIPLEFGANQISIVVTAENGEEKTYTVTVRREL